MTVSRARFVPVRMAPVATVFCDDFDEEESTRLFARPAGLSEVSAPRHRFVAVAIPALAADDELEAQDRRSELVQLGYSLLWGTLIAVVGSGLALLLLSS